MHVLSKGMLCGLFSRSLCVGNLRGDEVHRSFCRLLKIVCAATFRSAFVMSAWKTIVK